MDLLKNTVSIGIIYPAAVPLQMLMKKPQKKPTRINEEIVIISKLIVEVIR